MAGPNWPPSRFWQYWAIAGMLVLSAAFWWGVEGYALHGAGRPAGQIGNGLLRFSLLVLNPVLILVWIAAAWLRRRVGERGYWQSLSLIAMFWAIAVLIIRMMA